jgi:hypothetical protein
MLYVIFVSLLLIVAAGTVEFRILRREHFVVVRLQRSVERASAPGETVLVDNRWLAMLLHTSSKSDLRQKLVVTKHGVVPDPVLVGHEEFVVVAGESDPILSSLRAKGFVLTQDRLWDDSGLASKLPFCGTTHIYFAVSR